jgi:small redox-active disulfide protein 2
MNIKILGSGCAKCKKLEESARKAVEEAALDATVEKVTDIEQIMNYGVMMTPALVVDEVVKSVGKVLSPKEIRAMLGK